ncbi:hypothetical protein [Devosia sp. SL43]|uniref:hypothetical protein n=1 Tax=Devosia sp. SL43 TaxID=2806348 RepID=UPI001F1C3ABF|nr:hypothetical protein [Devosia sp. SL43]UJW87912.1 hypothetical protein IM737_20740 [Devosia sp. SL43]
MNRKFSDHVTQTAFHLTLSRNMIGTMARIRNHAFGHDGAWTASGADQFIMGAKALTERGLVVHSQVPDATGKHWTFTEAGEHVFQLLVIAGLVTTEAANDQAA